MSVDTIFIHVDKFHETPFLHTNFHVKCYFSRLLWRYKRKTVYCWWGRFIRFDKTYFLTNIAIDFFFPNLYMMNRPIDCCSSLEEFSSIWSKVNILGRKMESCIVIWRLIFMSLDWYHCFCVRVFLRVALATTVASMSLQFSIGIRI